MPTTQIQNEMKSNPYLMTALLLAGMLQDNSFGRHHQEQKDESKNFYCKKCGKEFKPISSNKTEYCSVECFKNRGKIE